jgi:hypothetical protein
VASIATSSIEEGLDFACNLVASGIEKEAQLRTGASARLLSTLAQYISLRYAGETGLALEYLAYLGGDIGDDVSYAREQFWAQLSWCAQEMGLDAQAYSGPNAWRRERG